MDIRLKAIHTVAVVLAAGVVLSQWPSWSHSAGETDTSASRTAILGRCVENAQLAHDVDWASACTQMAERQKAAHASCMDAGLGREQCDRQFPHEESSRCTLPPERAAVLDAALEVAEDRCVEESARAAAAAPVK